ncbi:hypothetical protein MPSEU_000713000 [Mayamaea pseudoterrestris]|nr:hypothetical protein MPSEU_000713000 [Mayamaea pseudoterrestris]
MAPATTNKSNENKPQVASKIGEPGAPLSLNMIKSSMLAKPPSDSGSSNGGNQSDTSALVGFGNFGFDFDSAEGNSTPPNSEQNENSSDSDGGPPLDQTATTANDKKSFLRSKQTSSMNSIEPASVTESERGGKAESSTSDLTFSGPSGGSSDGGNSFNTTAAEHHAAAANAAANLKSIAAECAAKHKSTGRDSSSRKRKAQDDEDDASNDGKEGEGYDSDNSSQASSKNPSKVTSGEGGKKKAVPTKKREERNAREKERSFRISKQINELRDLLSAGGVIVAKGTKSSVLTEAANYIRMLQQHQYRSEIDRHQLIQQMQLIGGGAQGPQAATAIRHVAAQNGVWSLGNFGGVPPRTAMSIYGNPVNTDVASVASSQEDTGSAANNVEPHDYRFIFNSCGVGMAVASMGGAFIDCNQLFCDLSGYSKQELCALTIFNLTARQNLREAFDLISQMISPPLNAGDAAKTIVLRGVMKQRTDLGIAMSLVKGEDSIAKCFCVTLVKNPTSPFDTSGPVPVSYDAINAPSGSDKGQQALNTQPAFTSG